MPTDTMSIGEKVKKLRKSKRETMVQLSKSISVSQSFISDLESNKKPKVSFELICKMADHYKVSLDYFR